MSTEALRIEHDSGCVAVLHYELDSSYCDPRDNDNLGVMVCGHKRYKLGDKQADEFRSDFSSWRQIGRYLGVFENAICLLPLGLYDHSGISMWVGSGAHWSDAGGWDSGQVGFIYTTKERIEELCGKPQIDSDPFYCPRTWPVREDGSNPNWEGTAAEWVEKCLRAEVEEYDAWLRGEVFWYELLDGNGEQMDSCGGFIGSDYAEEMARAALEKGAEDWLHAEMMRKRYGLVEGIVP